MGQTSGFLRRNAPFLAAGALLTFLSSFGQTFFISVFGGEIRAETGLSNGSWGLVYMAATLASAATMLWVGPLADRIRVRRLGVLVALGVALGCAAMASGRSVPVLVGTIFLLRLAGQGMAMHLSAVAMARWFTANRGRALAVAAFGVMGGEAVLPLAMAWGKAQIDWRWLWWGAAALCLLSAPLLTRLLRLERHPTDLAEETAAPGMGGIHWTRGEALADPIFWMMAPAVMSFAGFATAFWFHQAHFAAVKGWDHLSLVAVFPLGTLALILSTVAYGKLVDRFGALRLLPIYLLPLVLAFLLHWGAEAIWGAGIAVVLMGLAGGGQAVLLNACWAELYGTRHLGAIKSAVWALMVVGSALGPGITGALIDAGVGFERQLLSFAAFFAVAALLLFRVRAKASQRLRR